MKLFLKYLISMFLFMGVVVADDLFIQVDLGNNEDIYHNTSVDYYNTTAANWKPETDNPVKNTDKLELQQSDYQLEGKNCSQYFCQNQDYFSGWGWYWQNRCGSCGLSSTQLVEKTCAGIALIDSKINGEKMVIEAVQNNEPNNISLHAFVPKLVIKRGKFSVKGGNAGGELTTNFLDINVALRVIGKTLDENMSDTETEKTVISFIKNNTQLKNWRYTHFKSALSASSSTYYYYVKRGYDYLNGLMSSSTVAETDKPYIDYIVSIIDLGNDLDSTYLSGFNISSKTNKNTESCIPSNDWQNLVNKVNNSINNNSSDTTLQNFMTEFAIDKSLISFNKVAYKFDYQSGTKKTCEGDCYITFGNNTYFTGGSGDNYCYCYNQKYIKSSNPILNKVYGYKVLTPSGKEWGSYARTIQFDANTTPYENTIINIEGEGSGDENKEELIKQDYGKNLEHINSFDTTPATSDSDSVDTLVTKVNDTTPINEVAEKCSPVIDEKFVGNLVFIDQTSLLLGNNEFLIKENYNDTISPSDLKLSNMLVNPVFNYMSNIVRKEHWILDLNETMFTSQNAVPVDADGNILEVNSSGQVIVGGTVDNSITIDDILQFPDMSKDFKDLSYYYLKNESDSAECQSALGTYKTTTPFILTSNTRTDLMNYTSGNLENKPNNDGHSQFTTPLNMTVINTYEDLSPDPDKDRGSDGEIDAEIEKRIDIANKANKLKYQDSEHPNDLGDQPLFPNNVFAFSYTTGYKPADDTLYNDYGPVGPFWNKVEKIVETAYQGCDEEVTVGSDTFIPSETVCVNKVCTAIACGWKEELTSTDVAAGGVCETKEAESLDSTSGVTDFVVDSTSCTWVEESFSNDDAICNVKETESGDSTTGITDYQSDCATEEEVEGTYSLLSDDKAGCLCSGDITTVPDQYDFTTTGGTQYPILETSESLQETRYTKYCYLEIEPMKMIIKRIKWLWEPSKLNAQTLDIQGYSSEEVLNQDTGEMQALTTQWGGWTQVDWKVYDEIELDGYATDTIDEVTWLPGETEPDCDWTKDFEVNGKEYNGGDTIVDVTQTELDDLASYTKGIAFAKKQIYSLDNEKDISQCLADISSSTGYMPTDEQVENCVMNTYKTVVGETTISNFTTHFDNNVISYYQTANEIGFGRKFVVRPNTDIRREKKITLGSFSSLINSTIENLREHVFRPRTIDKTNIGNIDIFWNKRHSDDD